MRLGEERRRLALPSAATPAPAPPWPSSPRLARPHHGGEGERLERKKEGLAGQEARARQRGESGEQQGPHWPERGPKRGDEHSRPGGEKGKEGDRAKPPGGGEREEWREGYGPGGERGEGVRPELHQGEKEQQNRSLTRARLREGRSWG